MKVFGLIGEKLSHSLSPKIHNGLYNILGLDAVYNIFQVKHDLLEAAVHGIKALDISGVNVTIPYKVGIMDYLDMLSPEAAKIGAVNTIKNNGTNLMGYNTDYIGFGRMLNKYNLDISGKSVVVLGTGGAAKSIVAYLEDNGVSKLNLVSRRPETIYHFENYEIIDYHQLSQIGYSDLLINCTPIGMYPNIDISPLEAIDMTKHNAVIDIIYNPFNTKLMQQAREHNIPSYNGLYMLVYQAVAAVEIWFDVVIPDDMADFIYQDLVSDMYK